MSRYIDADELYVDWYDSFVADDGTTHDNIPFISKGQIDDAPTIDIPTWIPCSERLPEHDEDVLITDEYGDVSIASIEFFERQPDPWQWADENGYRICYKVLAWMPRPESYKKKNDELAG